MSVTVLLRKRDEDGGKHGEHIGLDEAYQHINEQHEHREQHRDHCCAGSHGITHRPEYEYEECLLKMKLLTKEKNELSLIEKMVYRKKEGVVLLEENMKRLEK